MASKFIGYIRVSTKGQGESGLGIEAQKEAIDRHCASTRATLVACYLEIESGRRGDRPELAKALAHAKRIGATLAVAKLDRLSRNVAFLSRLMESRVDFIACDNPAANKLTVHILAAVAEHEADAISLRTKSALAAYKVRGGKLGASLRHCRNLDTSARRLGAKRSAEVRSRQAKEAYADVAPVVYELRRDGKSLQQIADQLHATGHTTRQGKRWNPVQISRILQREAPGGA